MSIERLVGIGFLAAAGAITYYLIGGPQTGFDILGAGAEVTGYDVFTVFFMLIALTGLCSAIGVWILMSPRNNNRK